MTVPMDQSEDGSRRWTAQTIGMGVEILDRMERAVAKVRERLLRATAALDQAKVPYAVVGGNAVASWVATVDKGAVRNTRDVDLLVRRSDLADVTRPSSGPAPSLANCSTSLCFATARGQAERGRPSIVQRRKNSAR